MGGVGGYDQLCCPASPKLLLELDLGLGCDNDRCLDALSQNQPNMCSQNYSIGSRTDEGPRRMVSR